jgi:nitrate reductase NapD
MDITSAIVRAAPHQREAVRARLAELPGLEIHAATPDGRFIVTIEGTPGCRAAERVLELHRLEGVLAATMVYQYSDEDMECEEGGA